MMLTTFRSDGSLQSSPVTGGVDGQPGRRGQGTGAVGVNGVLVDAAHVKMAEQTLARAALINSSRAR